MKKRFLERLIVLLSIFFALSACENNDQDKDVNIVGVWQMYGTTQYGIEFTNNGIAIWKHRPYVNTDMTYSINGNSLTVNNVVGIGTFSNNGNTLTISGFSNPSSFGSEGSTGPFINGTYVRQ
jgi:hypothetical protein